MPRERVLADLIDELSRQPVEEIVSWHDNGRSRRIGQPQGELLFNNTSPESEKLRVPLCMHMQAHAHVHAICRKSKLSG